MQFPKPMKLNNKQMQFPKHIQFPLLGCDEKPSRKSFILLTPDLNYIYG